MTRIPPPLLRHLIAIVAFSSWAYAAAAADCNAVSPAAVAQQFFAQHRTFYFEETPSLASAVTPSLHRALRNHYRCAAKQGLCHIDYDPWLGAQDGEMDGPVRYSVLSVGKGKARVALGYRFTPGPGHPAARRRAMLHLEAADFPQCWRVSDLITPLGDSLAQRYRGRP